MPEISQISSYFLFNSPLLRDPCLSCCLQLCDVTHCTGAIPISDTRFGRGDGLPILLDDMACNGSETSLTECANAGVHIHDCDHSEDAGVICEGAYVDNVIYVKISYSLIFQ